MRANTCRFRLCRH